MYFTLFCETCGVEFKPLVATSADELLYPELSEGDDGPNFEALLRFHEEHGQHVLGTCPAAYVVPTNLRGGGS